MEGGQEVWSSPGFFWEPAPRQSRPYTELGRGWAGLSTNPGGGRAQAMGRSPVPPAAKVGFLR